MKENTEREGGGEGKLLLWDVCGAKWGEGCIMVWPRLVFVCGGGGVCVSASACV